jgi:hypothetical protein
VNLRSARLWITLVSLTAVSLFALVDTRRASPGPISSVHGNVEDLQGRSGCSECHGGWFSTMTESCAKCHAPIQKQIDEHTGLHGHLDAVVASRCANCHSEHHGESFAIVNDKSFQSAGAKNAKEFDHDLVGFHMGGRHLEVGCVDCHDHALDTVLAEGTVRYLGLAQDCGSCHEDPHEGRMQVACAACHGQTTWDALHSLGHEKFLPLVGGHGDLSCRKCHAEDDPRSLESMGMKGPRPPPRDCAACHDSPHRQDFARGNARLASMAIGKSCVACHAAEHTSFRQPGLEVTAEQHAKSGFPLEDPHDKQKCADCHEPEGGTFAERYPGRDKDTCTACHADPHGGQFAKGPFAGQQCTACHAREHFEPHTFGLELHQLASLHLDGKHLDTKCNDCHEAPPATAAVPKPPRIFHGTPSDCDGCHTDAHGGFFDDVVGDIFARAPAPVHGQCELCHTTNVFAEILSPGFDHARFADFPIRGAHAEGECSACHVPAAKPDESGRTFGRVEEHFGEFKGCVTCHTDPHGDQFDKPGMPAEIDGRADCARCHDEASFRSQPHGFDHGQWTGFDLVGEHDTACSACHEPLRQADAIGRTWKRSAGARCSDCHIDPHAGQFSGERAKDCAACHTDSQPTFSSFNHDRDSLFPLREQHEGLACDKCHKTQTDAEGFDVVRYRPLGRECVHCHGVQEDALMHRKRRNG